MPPPLEHRISLIPPNLCPPEEDCCKTGLWGQEGVVGREIMMGDCAESGQLQCEFVTRYESRGGDLWELGSGKRVKRGRQSTMGGPWPPLEMQNTFDNLYLYSLVRTYGCRAL